MTDDINQELAYRIAYLQENSDLNQLEVAKQLGLDRTAFSKIKNGTRKVSAEELNKLADVYGVTTDYLLGRKVDLGDVPVAAHLRGGLSIDDLPEDRRKAVEDYIEYQKARYKKEHEGKKD